MARTVVAAGRIAKGPRTVTVTQTVADGRRVVSGRIERAPR